MGCLYGGGGGTKSTGPNFRTLLFTSSVILDCLRDLPIFPFPHRYNGNNINNRTYVTGVARTKRDGACKALDAVPGTWETFHSVSCYYENDVILNLATIVSLDKYSPSKGWFPHHLCEVSFLGLKFGDLYPIHLGTRLRPVHCWRDAE